MEVKPIDHFMIFVMREFDSVFAGIESQELFRENVRRDLLLKPPKTQPTLSPRQRFVGDMYWGVREVDASLESLRNVEIYVRRFPYGKAGVKRSAYLRYHYENYLHEVYILSQRLEAFLKRVGRAYRKERDSEAIGRFVETTLKTVEVSFQRALVARGHHVHKGRIQDVELSRLETLEILTSRGGFKNVVDEGFRETRQAKLRWLRGNNAEIEKLMKVVFNPLRTTLTAGGSFRYPRRIAA